MENRSHSFNTTIQYSNSVNSCVFSCCVSGNNSAGEGPQNCVLGRECSLFLVTFVYCIECTAIPAPPRNVTVQPSQTSLLIEWMEPEQLYGRFNFYYVVCGTQTRPRVSSRRIYSITETTVILTGLSVFTRYECCVTVNVDFIEGIPTSLNATTTPGMPCGLVCNYSGIARGSKWGKLPLDLCTTQLRLVYLII